MSIKVYCPKCDAPIKAPDSAAGTRIDCPECDARVRVPDPDDRPRRRAGRDDPDDRPWKSKKKGKKKARPSRRMVIGLIAGGAAVLLAVLVVGGILAYRLLSPGPDKTMAGADWYKVDDPEGVFTAYFPGGKPKYEKVGVGFEPPGILAQKIGLKGDLGFGSRNWSRKDGGREYLVVLLKFPSGGSSDAAEQAATRFRTPTGPGLTVVADEGATVSGHQARRTLVRSGDKAQASQFVGIGGGHFLIAMVVGDPSVSLTDAKVTAFLDNVTVNR